MNKKIAIYVAFVALLTSLIGATPSAKTHYYAVEYEKPGQVGVASLEVIFYVPVTPQQADKVLRLQFQAAIDFEKPTTDALATAWDGRTKRAGMEDRITLPGGVRTLIWHPAQGKIITDVEDKKK